jgi:hypothetical protein
VIWLLDTDCLSVGSPMVARLPGADAFRGWLTRNGERLFLSAVSLAEIAYGTERLLRRGAGRKAELLGAWRDDLLAFHRSRIIDLDPGVARRAAPASSWRQPRARVTGRASRTPRSRPRLIATA